MIRAERLQSESLWRKNCCCTEVSRIEISSTPATDLAQLQLPQSVFKHECVKSHLCLRNERGIPACIWTGERHPQQLRVGGIRGFTKGFSSPPAKFQLTRSSTGLAPLTHCWTVFYSPADFFPHSSKLKKSPSPGYCLTANLSSVSTRPEQLSSATDPSAFPLLKRTFTVLLRLN